MSAFLTTRRTLTRAAAALTAFALTQSVLACSSNDTAKTTPAVKPGHDGGSNDAGNASACHPDTALAAHRDACEFATGAAVVDTIGDCTGDAIPIEHIVVLMQENRSFDEYLGHLKGHGLDDLDVAPADATNPAPAGPSIPWHHEAKYCQPDTDHGWEASHTQWNGGKMDGFATTNVDATRDPTGSRAMGYYDQTDLPFYYSLYSTFATSDRYFCSVLGPTYPNRMYLYAGTSFGIVTTDITKLAPKASPFLLRQLDEKGVTWKVYKTNLTSVLLFSDYALDAANADRFVQIDQFAVDAAAGTLPQLSIIDSNFNDKAWLEDDEHPPADAQLGQHLVWKQVSALTSSPLWSTSAFFITYDEHGGLYDHVSPPAACVPDDTPPAQSPELGGFDRLGFRVPVAVVSPFAKRHFVSHQVHSHTSILRFIQAKFDLPALTKRDANSDAMLDFFDFEHPTLDVPTFEEPTVNDAQIGDCKAAFP